MLKNMYRKMKISQKLMVAFVIVAFIASLSGFISTLLIRNINETNHIALEHYALPQGDVANAMLSITQCQYAIANMISFTDQNAIHEQKAAYEENWKNYNEIYAPAVKRDLATDEGKEIFEEIETNSANWQRIKDRVLEMGNTTDPAQIHEAQKLLLSDLTPAFQQMYKSYSELMRLKINGGNEYGTKAFNQGNFAIILNMITIVCSFIAAVLLGIFVSRGLSHPIRKCAARLNQLSEGDLSSPVPEINSEDEIGMLANSTKTIAHTVNTIIGDLSYGLVEMSEGNFVIQSKAEEYYVGDFKPLAESMYGIISKLSATIAQMERSAEQVSSGSDQVASGAQALSQGATEQASSIEELSASLSEISEHIQKNAQNANVVKDISSQTAGLVEEGSAQMEKMMEAMAEIHETSQQINKIIKTIDDIAFQTNILALNAAVEAARAGAAGKGFAVVADEVRNLAGKSAEAAKNTTALIENSISAVEKGNKMVDKTAEYLRNIVSGTQKSSSLIDSIALATNEQAISINQVTLGVEQISSVVQTNSATAEESAAASEELSGQAQMLNDLVSQFQIAQSIKEISSEQISFEPHPELEVFEESKY